MYGGGRSEGKEWYSFNWYLFAIISIPGMLLTLRERKKRQKKKKQTNRQN